LYDAWTSGCEQYRDADGGDSGGLVRVCAGNAGAYRSLFAASVFFALAGAAAACRPTANREAWPAKFVLFAFGAAAMVFVPNDPLFNPIYLWVARSAYNNNKTILLVASSCSRRPAHLLPRLFASPASFR
jgi:hypothetical protein